jgi:penicillin amidase
MLILFRWLLRLTVAALALAALGVAGAVWIASRSLPDYDATLRVAGLSAPVEIVRDVHNVPHVFGATDPDVFFGLGFAHAQDRLWQMTMLRRTAQGRLSELFGERTLAVDRLLRQLDLYGLAQQSVAGQDGYAQAALDAYSAGFNAWLDAVNRGARGRGAPEFFLFRPEIAPWTPADSIAIHKLMALDLTAHLTAEVRRARAALALPPERLRDILPEVPGAGTAVPMDSASGLSRPRSAANGPALPGAGLPGASNAWAAMPERAAAGGTLLAGDPHLGLSAPSRWYLARLELASGGVIGGTIPGMPLVLAGRSDRLGWASTTAGVDDQDLYVEELNPANPEEYRTPAGWQPFAARQVLIGVAGGPAERVTLRWTENGPVLPQGAYDADLVTPAGHVMSLAWTLLDPDDRSISAVLGIMRAPDLVSALAAGADLVGPAQNVVLADRGGIALQLMGRVPRRDADHQSQGRLPSPGWRVENRWQGAFPYAENPRIVNPPEGIVGNTNNKVTDAPFPRHLSFRYGDSQRIQRWQKLMGEREVHTRDSFIEAQLDTVSPAARTLLPLIARDLWFTGEPAPARTVEGRRARALLLLAEWNGEMNEHRPEPLIYAAWIRALNERLIRDELGPLAAQFQRPDPLFLERVFRDTGGAAAWCDVVQSSRRESCTDIARQALDAALLALSERYGPEPAAWRWGDAHVAHHDHEVLGAIPLLAWAVNIRQSTSGGDHTLMRGQTAARGAEPFANIHAAGYRGVYDFADPDSSVYIQATGQSGHFLSAHYDDLGELWRRGEYIPMSLDPDLARAAAVGVTRLEPAESSNARRQ